MPSMNEMKELKSQFDAKKADIKAQYKQIFHDGCNALFAEYPDLRKFGWSQYTPDFNDGDECIFRAHIDYPKVNGYDENSGEYDDNDEMWDQDQTTAWNEKRVDAEYKKLVGPVKEFLNLFSEEDLKDIFGDHVKILVTRKGIEVSAEEHE